MRTTRAFVAFIALGMLLATIFTKEVSSATTPNIATMPAWELKTLDGKVVKSADYAGKVLVVDFWASWCPPCRKEIPTFNELQKKYGPEGLMVVGLSTDEPEDLKPFLKKTKVDYPVVLTDTKTQDAFGGIEVLPTTFVIDRDGKVVAQHVGLATLKQFEKDILPLLKAPKKD